MRSASLLHLSTIVLLSAPVPVAAQADAALQLLRRTEAHAGTRADLLRRPAARSGTLVDIEVAADGTELVGVLVQVRTGAALDALRALDARIGGSAGDVVSIRLPVASLAALDATPGVVSAQAARLLAVEPQVDTSTVVIRADALRSHTGARWSGATGRGTLIGVYDTGLDVRHRDFIDALGSTRVLAAWDQTLVGSAAADVGYGVVCEREDVQQTIESRGSRGCPLRDRSGHGTHVTGTAAGNGAANGRFDLAGVAPEADLLIVKGGDGTFSESLIIDGLVWLRDRAQALGRPIVVNLSLGGQAGPHDGSRLFERAIDNLSGPGFVIVAAAGNDGQNLNTTPPTGPPQYFHARGIASTSVTRFTLDVDSYTPFFECGFNSLFMELWYEAADSVEVSVVRPDGTRASAATGTEALDSSDTGRILIYNAAAGPSATNDDAEVLIVVDSCDGSGLPAQGSWMIEAQPRAALVSGAPIDMWLHTLFIGTGLVFGRDGFDNRFVVGSPAAARRAIAVGAFVSRLCWTIPNDQGVCYTQRESVGDLARFSSAGPTRDGRLKPEITAPGLGIAAALSRHAVIPFQRVFGDGQHAVFEGTSMAAPHVTGAIALLMEHDPSLDPEAARALLAGTAATDAFTARRYDASSEAEAADWWGHGKLDACAAVVSVASSAGAGVWVAPAADSLPQGATLPLKVCAHDGGARIAWHSSEPHIVSVDAQGVASALEEGTALVIASDGTDADTAALTVVAPSTLTIGARAANTSDVVRTQRDTRIPLLGLTLASDGVESVDVEQVGITIEGIDESAWIVLAEANPTGSYDATPPFLAASQLPLNGTHVAELRPEMPIRVAARDTAYFVVLLQTSGAVPNGTRFTISVAAEATNSIAARSGARDRIAITGAGNVTVESTLLSDEQALRFSENPVRRALVHFNFVGCPVQATVHTLTGTRVRDLRPLLVCGDAGGHAVWDLRNDDGAPIAPGVYLVLFDLDGRIFREKLMVLRADAP